MRKLLLLTITAAVIGMALYSVSYAEKALVWKGNSKAMYDKVIGSMPEMLRSMMSGKFKKTIVAKAGDNGTVTEDMVIEAVKETTPGPFIDKTLKDIEPLKSK